AGLSFTRKGSDPLREAELRVATCAASTPDVARHLWPSRRATSGHHVSAQASGCSYPGAEALHARADALAMIGARRRDRRDLSSIRRPCHAANSGQASAELVMAAWARES